MRRAATPTSGESHCKPRCLSNCSQTVRPCNLCLTNLRLICVQASDPLRRCIGRCLTRFSHIVGYGATYYSYLFAQCLSARIWQVGGGQWGSMAGPPATPAVVAWGLVPAPAALHPAAALRPQQCARDDPHFL